LFGEEFQQVRASMEKFQQIISRLYSNWPVS